MKKIILFIPVFLFILLVNGQSLYKAEFRINDDSLAGDLNNPRIVMDEKGRSVVVWHDIRRGFNSPYAQFYDNQGNPVDSNLFLQDDYSYYRGYDPFADIHNDSVFIAWSPYQGKWYNMNGSSAGSEMRLNLHSMRNPAVSVGDSNVFIVWRQYESGLYDVNFQGYDFNGDSIMNMINLDEDSLNYHYQPDIAMDNNGNMVIVWTNSNTILARMVEPSGNLTGSNFIVNDDTTYAMNPSVEMADNGDFLVVWEDRRTGTWEAYGQLYDSTGSRIDSNFLIASYIDNLECDMLPDGRFGVVYYDRDISRDNLYCKLYSADGDTAGMPEPFPVDMDTSSSPMNRVGSIAMNDSLIEIAWRRYYFRTNEIVKRRFDLAGTPREDNILVNDKQGLNQQYDIDIAVNSIGQCIAVWDDERPVPGIYSQRMDSTVALLDSNYFNGTGNEPHCHIFENGDYIVSYEYNDLVYYQAFNWNGDSLYDRRIASDSTGLLACTDMDGNIHGYTAVVWADFRNGDYDVYGDMIDTDGNTIGADLRISDDMSGAHQTETGVSFNDNGKCLVVWHDYRNGDYDIYGQMLDQNFNKIGYNFRIDDSPSGVSDYRPSVGVLDDARFLVVWGSQRDTQGIYGQVVDTSGALIDSSFLISEDIGGYHAHVSNASDSIIVVVWHSSSEGTYDIFGKIYYIDLTQKYYAGRVNEIPYYGEIPEMYPRVAMNQNKIYFAWEGARWQMADDVVGKIYSRDMSGIFSKSSGRADCLSVNNPLITGNSVINYSLASGSHIEISLMDITGREVRTLVNGYRTAGNHLFEWETKDKESDMYPSGVYFIKLAAGNNVLVKKVMFIR